jgi:HSP20 family protein
MDLELWDPFNRRKKTHSFFDEFFPTEFFEPIERMHPMNLVREPLVDVIDKGSHYEVMAELPGVDKKDIKVNVDNNSVCIEAEKKLSLKEEDKKKGHFYSERSYSKFFRKIPLNSKIIPDKSSAEMHEGLLKLKLEKLKPVPAKEESFKVEIK